MLGDRTHRPQSRQSGRPQWRGEAREIGWNQALERGHAALDLGGRVADRVQAQPPRNCARFFVAAEKKYAPEIAKLAGLGLVECAGGRLRLTRRGLLFHDEVAAQFVGGVASS